VDPYLDPGLRRDDGFYGTFGPPPLDVIPAEAGIQGTSQWGDDTASAERTI